MGKSSGAQSRKKSHKRALAVLALLTGVAASSGTWSNADGGADNAIRDREIFQKFPIVTECHKSLPESVWMQGLTKRVNQDWSPLTRVSRGEVAVNAWAADNGVLYDAHIAKTSGDAQMDADALQAVLGAAAYAPVNRIFSGREGHEWYFKIRSEETSANAIGESTGQADNKSSKATVSYYNIPIDIMQRFPGMFEAKELLSQSNILTVQNGIHDENSSLGPFAIDRITKHSEAWTQFFRTDPNPPKRQILIFAANFSRFQ